MNLQLMKILCCPVCKNDLELTIDDQIDEEVIQGKLYCKSCEFTYPIEEGIPNLLPPEYHKK